MREAHFGLVGVLMTGFDEGAVVVLVDLCEREE
jgi:hypothetical protein